jgi:hypothetical protein
MAESRPNYIGGGAYFGAFSLDAIYIAGAVVGFGIFKLRQGMPGKENGIYYSLPDARVLRALFVFLNLSSAFMSRNMSSSSGGLVR